MRISEKKHSAAVGHLKYRPDIDGLRAVAVLAVVGFHTFPQALRSGFVGVDLFFVISGYLITKIILGQTTANGQSLISFYSRRIQRIFPALILVLTSTFCAGYFLLLPFEFKQLGNAIAAGGGFIANILYSAQTGYFDSASESKPLLHLWSLAVEEQFYLVWPVLLIAVSRLKINIVISIIAVLLISFLINVSRIAEHPAETFFLPFGRFWELAVGGFLCCLGLDRSLEASQKWRNAIAALGLLLIAISIFALEKVAFPGWYAVLPALGTAALIYVGPRTFVNDKLLSNRGLVIIGLISYPVYLWHWPILYFARFFYGSSLPTVIRCVVIIISLILGWLTYRFIERPVRSGRSYKTSAALVATLALTILVGYAAYDSGGMPSRFPPIFANLESVQNKTYTAWRGNRCFLNADRSTSFSAECVELEPSGAPHVVIWGDSHAAALYPGLKALQSRSSFRLSQLTTSACPPFLSVKMIHQLTRCDEASNNTLAIILQSKPEVVILHANWIHPGYNVLKDQDQVQQSLQSTVSRLRSGGVKKIILLGLIPQWLDGLPNTLFKYYWHGGLSQVPQRIPYTNLSVPLAEQRLRDLAIKLGVDYVSTVELLCNSDAGCLAQIGDGVDASVSIYDYGHLTLQGSMFLATKFERFLVLEKN